ncbi:MAG: hypothetical protein A2W52_01895 [Candidatus Taylorbacteria bacterium RIFCSPHIGHO2_02_49_25]|uniref:DUF378 domain-containing protein n=1 Tax=Candidatus Taylorbacteria bacterium RIFCSPHIGHO2_02_49_25 TaxID=1802305 RepID=A0A1G2MCG0_9BACT|nr:MAG: hypothetical protein A2759_03535 [Candidatus Taylorbacteria bacterium RIFCSPHIGHO2_01_FULL_49_60]OHA21577.1 MAG: hypothetical protein A2W52_01895 [Candidatus Taylorbacteria bacterium RIFCSPHIGHO2_02_49_25]OHA36653.1 MAG: hypothetical protein A3B27_00630 [Candidatus Taylorbacteria bacterium RIFCSPLOWO2_01_FULL_50_130]OHA42234.1 MAG: hypothetical protein A3H73_02440 [Candidatus Taylorbacteria bacterium RIFCSPLOWO2_02_FULL_50_120]OHA46932.1 MAG: hypothetical protein A3G61_04555 [Candidatus
MKTVHIISFILLVIGGLNWGLVGLGVDDLVTRILGEGLGEAVFILVGLAAIVEVVTHKKTCKMCPSSNSGASVGGAI